MNLFFDKKNLYGWNACLIVNCKHFFHRILLKNMLVTNGRLIEVGFLQALSIGRPCAALSHIWRLRQNCFLLLPIVSSFHVSYTVFWLNFVWQILYALTKAKQMSLCTLLLFISSHLLKRVQVFKKTTITKQIHSLRRSLTNNYDNEKQNTCQAERNQYLLKLG